MKKLCELKMYTKTSDGEYLSCDTEARYYYKHDRHYLLFELDNDKCHIEYDDKELLYKRQGELTYEMRLRSGNSSEMALKTAYGVMHTDYMVYFYEADIAEDTAEINIDYRSAGENYHMRIEVRSR